MSVPPQIHETVVFNHGEDLGFNESKDFIKNLSATLESSEYANLYCNHVKKEIQDEEYKQLHDRVKTENRFELIDTSEYVNKYDTHVKKEITDEDCTSSFNSIKSIESLQFIKNQSMGDMIGEKELVMSIKIEDKNKYFPVSVNNEILSNQEVLYDNGDTSIHCDVLVNPRRIACKLCHEMFESSDNLYKHNIKHLRIQIETRRNNNLNELQHVNGCGDTEKHKCDSCTMVFTNKKTRSKHRRRVHHDYGRTFGCVCGKQYRTPYALNDHRYKCHSRSSDTTFGNYECSQCKKIFKIKRYLTDHLKRIHHDYGRTFDCVCGKQFTTPYTLKDHRYKYHCRTTDNTFSKFECELCGKIFKIKRNLMGHKRRVHYNFGRTFDCVCGKQFTSPYGLNNHRYTCRSGITDTTFGKYECDTCKKVFKNKRSLTAHIKSIHHDYGRTFDCECGKQFNTPHRLNTHRYRSHGRDKKQTTVDRYECDSCKKIFKSKVNIAKHILRLHYDYEKLFVCWCGDKFPSPVHLSDHKYSKHGRGDNITSECNSCKKAFTTKRNLLSHIKRAHRDYGRTFDCWCGEKCPSPVHLREHKYRKHSRSGNN